MEILIINFSLEGMTEAEYRKSATTSRRPSRRCRASCPRSGSRIGRTACTAASIRSRTARRWTPTWPRICWRRWPRLRASSASRSAASRCWRGRRRSRGACQPRPRSLRMAAMDCRSAGSSVVGRDFELSVLLRVSGGARTSCVLRVRDRGHREVVAAREIRRGVRTPRDRRRRGRLPVDRADRAGVPGRSGSASTRRDHHLDHRPRRARADAARW